MKQIVGSVILLVIAFWVTSCDTKDTSDLALNNIQFDTIRIEKKYHLNNDSTQPSCNLKINFVYPVQVDGLVSLDSLQSIFVSCLLGDSYAFLSPQDAVDNYAKNYIDSYKEDAQTYEREKIEEHDSVDSFLSYQESIDNRIVYNKSGFLTFQITQVNYKGGAFPYNFVKNYVIDIETAKLIVEEDLFVEGYEKQMAVLMVNTLLKNKGVKTIKELEDIGYFGLDEMQPNGNFLLDDKGLTYIFNKGEYSGYKTDPIMIFLPYEEVSTLIKEGSLIAKFI